MARFGVFIGNKYYPLAGSHVKPPKVISPKAKLTIEALEKNRQRKKLKRERRAAKLKAQALKPKFAKVNAGNSVTEWAARMRLNPTKEERELMRCCRLLKLNARPQVIFGNQLIGRRIVDILVDVAGHLIAIEADGSQHYTKEGLEADAIRSKFFATHYPGVSFLRYRNWDIMKVGFEHTLEADIDKMLNPGGIVRGPLVPQAQAVSPSARL